MELSQTVSDVATWSVDLVPLIVGAVVLVAIFGLLVAILVVLVRAQKRSLAPEEVKQAIQHAEERARSIVAEAHAAAREARLEIEKERVRALNEDQQATARFVDAYTLKLDKVVQELSYGLEKEHMRVTSKFVEGLQSIEERVAHNAGEAKQSMDSFTNQSSALFERLAVEIENVERGIQHLALALQEAAANEADRNADIVRREMQKIGKDTAASVTEVARGLDKVLRDSVEGEFTRISNELSQYRAARMNLVDERILSLIEETTEIVLQKKLSMQDQADLVYRSLEDAKERGVFV